MALESIDVHFFESKTGPLLSNDDQQRILESQEFDYDIGSLQKNQITSQNLFDDEAKVVDLILEEEIQFKEEISEREFNSFCKYLTSDFETGVETACNLRAAAPDDYSVEEKLDSANSTAYEENVSFAEDRNIEKRCISSSKTKRGRKYTQNERNVKCKCNLASRKPQVKKKSSKRISKHRKLQVTELNDGNKKLDEFLMELLNDDKYSSFIHWTYKERKEFKLVNAGQISNLWGNLKGKKKFTSDKLLREMRHLRSNGVMDKLDRKDHYRFS